jgi:hypothetical protein
MYETNFLWKHFHSFLLIVQKSYDSLIYCLLNLPEQLEFFFLKIEFRIELNKKLL